METKHIPVVLGTARKNRQSEKVARAVTNIISGRDGYSTELVDVKGHVAAAATLPPWGEGGANEKPTEWQRIVRESHALILIIPEYNHGYPGELKLLLDSLWEDYKHKAVGLVGVSAGTLGGARVVDHIKPVLIELNLHPVKESVYISQVEESVHQDGTFANAKVVDFIEKMIDEVVARSSKLA